MYFTPKKYFTPLDSTDSSLHETLPYDLTNKLPLANSSVLEFTHNRIMNKSNSKELLTLNGFSHTHHNMIPQDHTQVRDYSESKKIRPSVRQYPENSSPVNYINLNEESNKINNLNTLLTPTPKKSSFIRSLRVSCVHEPFEPIEPKIAQNRQNEMKTGDILKEKRKNHQRSVSRDSFNFRESLGSLSQQIKNTLKSTLNNKINEQKNVTIQNVTNQNNNKCQTEEDYTRYEKTTSFYLNPNLNHKKRTKFFDSKKYDYNSQTYSDKQNKPFDEKVPVTSRFGRPHENNKQMNKLGRSSVTSSVSTKQNLLKHSFVVEPMTPQLRTAKKYDSYNCEKQKKKYQVSSFKPDVTSVSSSIKTPTNQQSQKPSFLQRSSVLSSNNSTPPQRSSFKSQQRSSFGKQLSLNDFHLGSVKGQGRFGKFYPAIHKHTGLLVGIKQIKKESLKNMLDQFIQELKIQSYIQHPNIVKLYGYFANQENFYLVMEYMQEGSLFSFIKRSKKLAEQQAAKKLKQVCSAVNYLHENEIIHRDIKPQNIVMTCDVCKLCDFGWAVYTNTRRKTYCGTLDYVCPEILQGETYDQCVDIWAMGVLAFEMIVGKAPFYNISRKQTVKKIMECNFELPKQISSKAKSFISKALNKNPLERESMANLINHEFLNE